MLNLQLQVFFKNVKQNINVLGHAPGKTTLKWLTVAMPLLEPSERLVIN